jgi:hypothetical protein
VRIRPIVKELEHNLDFNIVPPDDLDPRMPKNNRVLPYMMTNISAKF